MIEKQPFTKRIKRKLRLALIAICVALLLSLSYATFSPRPAAWLVKQLFEGGMAVPPDNFEELLAQTRTIEDIDYGSNFPNGKLDIIFPKEKAEDAPVIFWVHGGAFVGGDKSDVTEYAVQLAANGYVVVNMNYALAPGYQYPTPLYQVSEAYEFIQKNAEKYGLSLENVYFAGDSAGAQIAAQYVNIQTDAFYAEQVGIEQTVDATTIKGALLFCGPFNLQRLSQVESGKIVQIIMDRVGWAYIGSRNWRELPETQLASVADHVTENFPASFITDGNTGSFEAHGVELAEILESKGVPVESVFFDKEVWGELVHNYQFLMNTEASQYSFEKLLDFLNKTT